MRRTVAAIVVVLCTSGLRLTSNDSGTAEIAAILLDFVHAPSPGQQDVLRVLVDASATDPAVRTIALAVLRLVHTPHPDDVEPLRMLAISPSQPAAIRTLAGIVSRVVHMPGASDRIELKRLLGRDVFMSAADLIDAATDEDVTALHKAAQGIDPDRPLLEQESRVRDFFRQAGDALRADVPRS